MEVNALPDDILGVSTVSGLTYLSDNLSEPMICLSIWLCTKSISKGYLKIPNISGQSLIIIQAVQHNTMYVCVCVRNNLCQLNIYICTDLSRYMLFVLIITESIVTMQHGCCSCSSDKWEWMDCAQQLPAVIMSTVFCLRVWRYLHPALQHVVLSCSHIYRHLWHSTRTCVCGMVSIYCTCDTYCHLHWSLTPAGLVKCQYIYRTCTDINTGVSTVISTVVYSYCVCYILHNIVYTVYTICICYIHDVYMLCSISKYTSK